MISRKIVACNSSKILFLHNNCCRHSLGSDLQSFYKCSLVQGPSANFEHFENETFKNVTFLERISKNAEFSVYVYLGVLYSLQKAEMKDIDKDVEWRQKDFFFYFTKIMSSLSFLLFSCKRSFTKHA